MRRQATLMLAVMAAVLVVGPGVALAVTDATETAGDDVPDESTAAPASYQTGGSGGEDR